MALSNLDIGQNIQRARYARGLSQAELANRIGLDRTAISRIENGDRSLSALELVHFAEALSVDVSGLLRTPPAKRNLGRARLLMRTAVVSDADATQLEWFIRLFEAAASTLPSGTLPPPALGGHTLTPTMRGEVMARRIRHAAGLDSGGPIDSMSGLAAKLGVYVCAARMPSRSRVSGCLITNGDVHVALVNSNHSVLRQRFTLAHEIGHRVLAPGGLVAACNVGEVRSGPRTAEEVAADVFASALLLPKQVTTSALPITYDRLDALGAEYGISRAAAISRLRALGLISDSDARLLRRFSAQSSAPRATPPYRVIGATLASSIAGVRDISDDDIQSAVVPDEEVVG